MGKAREIFVPERAEEPVAGSGVSRQRLATIDAGAAELWRRTRLLRVREEATRRGSSGHVGSPSSESGHVSRQSGRSSAGVQSGGFGTSAETFCVSSLVGGTPGKWQCPRWSTGHTETR